MHLHGVLLVDDHRDARQAIAALLGEAGFAVVEAVNGREALQLLQNGLDPCLILLDLYMPEMSGFEFREAQLEDPYLAGIPVAICSADPIVRERAAQLAVRDFVEKPIDPDCVMRMVERYCERRPHCSPP